MNTNDTQDQGAQAAFIASDTGQWLRPAASNKMMSSLALVSPGTGMQLKRTGGKVWCNYFHLNDAHF